MCIAKCSLHEGLFNKWFFHEILKNDIGMKNTDICIDIILSISLRTLINDYFMKDNDKQLFNECHRQMIIIILTIKLLFHEGCCQINMS